MGGTDGTAELSPTPRAGCTGPGRREGRFKPGCRTESDRIHGVRCLEFDSQVASASSGVIFLKLCEVNPRVVLIAKWSSL